MSTCSDPQIVWHRSVRCFRRPQPMCLLAQRPCATRARGARGMVLSPFEAPRENTAYACLCFC